MTEIKQFDSYEIISINPQVVKINDIIFYGFYLLNKDEKIINIISVTDNLYEMSPEEITMFHRFSYKCIILCVTSLNKCIRLFNEFKWNYHNNYTQINFDISHIKFNESDLSVSFDKKIEKCQGSWHITNYKYNIKYDVKQNKYITTGVRSYTSISPEPISEIQPPLATNFTAIVSLNYNKDDDIMNSYEKIKSKNDSIVEHLNSIVELNKIKNDEIETLKIINKKHCDQHFKDVIKDNELLKKENILLKHKIDQLMDELNKFCFRCYDKYIKPTKIIKCEHKYICHICTLKITKCPTCDIPYD